LIHFPNAFSPNGDNVNDVFSAITYLTNVESPDLNIYNRWGELIFHTNDITITWNGEFNGEPMPVGSYPYTFTFNCFAEPQKLTGNVMLVK
ncbi:MAG: gliding motility-associated C-terminal domain-containing protein, partial [Fimbriimonadaceae bacterium]|nr:gliding motility-associated C-terminal domain-containing protein [Chitinophagales bacterium]